jgi:hypothetical protein
MVFSFHGKRWEKQNVKNSFAGLFGAVIGVVLIFIHNYIFTGDIAQNSAKMKFYWASFQEYPIYSSLVIAARTFGVDLYLISNPIAFISILWIMFMTFFLIVFVNNRIIVSYWLGAVSQGDPKTKRGLVLSVASVLCVMAYIVLYTKNGGVQNWYTANYSVPAFVIVSWITKTLFQSKATTINLLVRTGLSIFVLSTIIININSVYPIEKSAPWKHQQAMISAGKYLKTIDIEGNIGSWNSGILGYYQGGQIINLDGLANDDVYYYVIKNDLQSYIKDSNITHLIDFRAMFASRYAERGGYYNADFLQNLEPIVQFDNGQFPVWQYLTFYEIRNQ